MKLLHLDASILGDHSVSRTVSAAVVAQLKDGTHDLEISYRDLADAPPAHLSAAHIGQGEPDATPSDLETGQAMLDEFLAADIVVIGAPMYNFTIPTQLKAWLDRILVAGKTFRYTESGPEGLAGGKRVIVAVSRGGHYGPESPASAFEHVETYLRTVFAFIGIPDPEIIVAEGVMVGPDGRQQAISTALDQAAHLQAA
ncbi:FMN-dependent NADH-azoreductase 1 [Methyloligella halotolerans]|uniref:FMN dependent NADH:quinone oxidoreductase n=1 Tax=Methyloligella halotolerans TaxID=1177755 RepID=A0A1E2RVR5_9HYPH|nr:NAD(P)H-dependent oxidoreductase [Methyloligella halotolerans]ODA66252.1 FMN-dependent NADH-azoreductase 1 [Methyloligella halotolerans]